MLGLAILFAVALVLLIAVASLLLAWEMRHPTRRTAAWAIARGRACDPDDMGVTFEDWKLDVDGALLPVWEIDGKASRQRGIKGSSSVGSSSVTIVMIHGWGESRVHLLSRLEPWIHHAARIIMYDLRGHGDAAGTASRLGDGEQGDLIQLIRELGNGPVVLVGWSMGGVIALAAAAEADDDMAKRIRGVVTIGAYADFHTSLRGRLRVQQLPTRPLTDLALIIQRITGVSPGGAASTAAGVRCPVLLIHGGGDDVVPAEQARMLDGLIPDSRCMVVAGGDHCEPRDSNADQFDEAVIQLLRDAGAAPDIDGGSANSASTSVPTGV